jgi:hypothetical protein
MNREAWVWLLSEYLSGRCAPSESAKVEEALRTREEVRDLYVDFINLETGLNQCADAVWMERQSAQIASMPSRERGWRRAWVGTAAGVALGLMAGIVLSASMVWAFAGSKTLGKGELLSLAHGDFETEMDLLSDGIPTVAGVWGGDFARVVEAEQGVMPVEGRHMLKFLRADNRLTPPESRPAVAEVWQVIDLGSQALAEGMNSRPVEVAARFHAAESAAGERMTFGVSLHAFTGKVGEAPTLWRNHKSQALASASQEELWEAGTASWQSLRARMVLPREATLLLVGLRASRKGDVPNRQEFGAHYVDGVQVYFVEPSSLPSQTP